MEEEINICYLIHQIETLDELWGEYGDTMQEIDKFTIDLGDNNPELKKEYDFYYDGYVDKMIEIIREVSPLRKEYRNKVKTLNLEERIR